MFLLVVGASCLVYLGIELLYITRVPYNADEVNVAGKIYRLKSEIPYVDFRPYKTVLGFYVQLPILFFSDDSLGQSDGPQRAAGPGHRRIHLRRRDHVDPALQPGGGVPGIVPAESA